MEVRVRFMMVLGATILSFVMASAVSADVSFPNSEIVLDMMTLSDAVYYLKNKVSSCNDPQAENKTLASSTREEVLSAHIHDDDSVHQKERIYLRRLQDDNQQHNNLFDTLLPEGTSCLHYSHDYDLGTQVLVVRSSIHKYVSVVYTGTDDFTTALMDGEILMGKFGPTTNTTGDSNRSDFEKLFDQVPEDAHVHRGFNSAVFESNHFTEVLECVTSAKVGGDCDGADKRRSAQVSTELGSSTTYQVLTSGHSLGAADSILLGAALHLVFPSEHIQSINFGCPKIGNTELVYWLDSLQSVQSDKDGSLEVFRFVNKLDLVPRLPDLIFFQHAGHTLQMSIGGEIRAYYNHFGDETLGYSGVPFGWDAEPYVLFPLAIYAHHHKHYVEYLQDYAPKSNASLKEQGAFYFVQDFERVENNQGAETSPTVVESE
ncbi:hypothetical protein ACHAWO_008549 [Cyclotella atomus]|uniref:Fungal lipase-type domain-containing protein n=1 Tax=Cyclotella atomus TaxID=382360 RepID=A0ABD3PJF2_9STRA